MSTDCTDLQRIDTDVNTVPAVQSVADKIYLDEY